MPPPVKQTKDEAWFEKTFKVKIAKLGADVQPGGKRYSEFSRDLGKFCFYFTANEKFNEGIGKMKSIIPIHRPGTSRSSSPD